jgi:hypothetical protein
MRCSTTPPDPHIYDAFLLGKGWIRITGNIPVFVFFFFYIPSDRRFNEYIPSRPLIGFGFFSCFE